MLQLEPVLMLVDVPGDLAAVAGGAVSVTYLALTRVIMTLYSRNIALEDRSREDALAAVDAIRTNTDVTARLVAELAESRDRARHA